MASAIVVASARRQYDAVVEGYHLNKRHWITVTANADVPDAASRQRRLPV